MINFFLLSPVFISIASLRGAQTSATQRLRRTHLPSFSSAAPKGFCMFSVISIKKGQTPLAKSEKFKNRLEKPLIFESKDDTFLIAKTIASVALLCAFL